MPQSETWFQSWGPSGVTKPALWEKMKVMSSQSCSICRMPVEPGADACRNCGAPVVGGIVSGKVPGLGTPKRRGRGILLSGIVVAGVVVGLAAVVGQQDVESETAAMGGTLRIAEVDDAEPQAQADQSSEQESVQRVLDADELEVAEPEETTGPGLIEVKYPARVLSSKGNKVKVGAPCVVNVRVLSGHIKDLDVTCAQKMLYDTRTPLNGMARVGGQVFERAGDGEQEWRYRLQYSDTGTRSQRSQVTLNSLTQEGAVFSEAFEAFRVEFRLSEYSLPREGAPIFETPREVLPLRRTAQVESTHGTIPKVPTACSIEARFLESTRGGPRCKTQLSCGSRVLYGRGNSGLGPCEIEDGAIARFADEEETHQDGDPSLILQVADGSIRLSDSPSQQSFSMTFRFAK